MRSPSKAVHAAGERASLRPALPDRASPLHHTVTHQPPQHPGKALATPAKTTLTPILPQERQGHKYRRPRASVSSYGVSTRPAPNSSASPQRQDATASHHTRDDQPSGSTDLGAEPGRPNGGAHCPDAQTIARWLPHTGASHGLPSPGQRHHDPCNTPPHPTNAANGRPGLSRLNGTSQALNSPFASRRQLSYEPFEALRDQVRRDGMNPFTSSTIHVSLLQAHKPRLGPKR